MCAQPSLQSLTKTHRRLGSAVVEIASAPKAKGAAGAKAAAPASSAAAAAAAGTLEGGDPDWTPPTNQTGDGRTALNAKFGY